MGVDGLLKALKTAGLTRPGSFADEAAGGGGGGGAWRGKTAVIDGYGWLHKAVYGCARRVAGKEAPFRDAPSDPHPEKFALYVLHRLGLLVHYGIRPVVVFDGCRLDAKRATNAARREGRADVGGERHGGERPPRLSEQPHAELVRVRVRVRVRF